MIDNPTPLQHTYTRLIATAFHLDVDDARRVHLTACPPGTRCALTAEPLAQGYPIAAIVSEAQGEWWETFNGNPYGFISPSAAALWGASNPKGINVMSQSFAVFGNDAYRPLVSQKSADAQGRPSWRDLARRAWRDSHDAPVAICISSDTKKRVWPRAAMTPGTLGGRTPVLIYDTGDIGMHAVRHIDWRHMLDDLDEVEELLEAGFNRHDVATTLYNNMAATHAMGWDETARAEGRLKPMRQQPHWPFVRLVARGLNAAGERL